MIYQEHKLHIVTDYGDEIAFRPGDSEVEVVMGPSQSITFTREMWATFCHGMSLSWSDAEGELE